MRISSRQLPPWARLALLLTLVGAPAVAQEPGQTYDGTPCRSCHTTLLAQKFRHSYFKDGTCDGCHLPAVRPSKCEGVLPALVPGAPAGKVGWRFPAVEPKLCQSCHEGIGFDEPVHRIIKLGGCTVCHNAHSSPNKKQLKEPVAQLCFNCHRRDLKRFVHEPVAKGACTECHDPHSALDNPMLKDSRADICKSCHEQKDLSGANHAAMKGICLDCHVAHASDEKGLLRPKPPTGTPKRPAADAGVAAAVEYETESCNSCHAELKGKKFRHGVFKGGGSCADCHEPSDTPGPCKQPVGKGWKLIKPDPQLCLGCHDGVQSETALHPIIKLRGCTACHDPHSADVKKNLKFEPQKLCLRCHQRKDPVANVHTPVGEGKCIGCHDPHSGEERPLLKTAKKDLCFECHDAKELAPQSVVHTPFTERRCLDCHEVHAGEHPKQLKAEGKQLCLSCHDSKAKPGLDRPFPAKRIDLTRATVHKPIVTGACQDCHVQTHSGPIRKLLKKKPPSLCYDCHDRQDTKPFTHGAVQLGDCPVCHDPHSSDTKPLLREKSVSAVCFRCHQDDVTGRAFVHKPVAQGQCIACHSPHGADDLFNLKLGAGKAVCYSCHKDVDTGKKKHGALERYGCVACHDPHGTANRFQLIKPVNELCQTCHPAQADGLHAANTSSTGHPVKGKVDPRRLDREFSCASCHNPHGTDNPKLFYSGNNSADMCDGCHGDRSGDHPELKDIHLKKRPPGWVSDAGSSLRPVLDAGLRPARPDAGTPDAGAPAAAVEAGAPSAVIDAGGLPPVAIPAPELDAGGSVPRPGTAKALPPPGARPPPRKAGVAKGPPDAGVRQTLPETPPIPTPVTP